MSGIPWTEKEDLILRKKYQSIGPTECFKFLPNRTKDTIQNRARRLGLTIEGKRCGKNRKPNSWTSEEIKILRENYPSLGPRGCQKLLPGRTISSISDRTRRLGLAEKNGRRPWYPAREDAWTKEEIQILKDNYIKVGPKKCRILLPRRSNNSIHTRVNILGLADKHRRHRWPEDVKSPEVDMEISKKYKRIVYRVYLVGDEKFALVEKRDLHKVLKFRWYYFRSKNKEYAYTAGHCKTLLMHRVIMSSKDGEEVDHWNSNGLDNVRKNLRRCTRAQNTWNRAAQSTKKSNPFKGVYWHHNGSKPWVARITANGKLIELGYHVTAEEAAKVVNKAIQRYHGRFGVLNKV